MWRKFISVPSTEAVPLELGQGRIHWMMAFLSQGSWGAWEPRGTSQSSVLSAPHPHGCVANRDHTEHRSRSGMSISQWSSLASQQLKNTRQCFLLTYTLCIGKSKESNWQGAGNFCIFQKKKYWGERSRWGFWPYFLSSLSFLIHSRRRQGWRSSNAPSCWDIFLVWATCSPAAVCNYSARQPEDVLSPPCFCICQTEFFFGQHLFLVPTWCCPSWPQK